MLQATDDVPSADLPDAPQARQMPAATPQQPKPDPQKPDQQKPENKESSDDQLKKEESQRLLGVMPAFNAVMSGHAEPLRPGQKFNLWFHSAIDPFQFGIAAVDAGIEQAENSYPEYHQGFVGFAKRYGASYADSVDGNLWGNAILPAVFHQDPRYFRLGEGSKKSRLWYSLISTVRCKGDDGHWQFSYSNIGGNLIGGAISNVYYPAADRGVGLTLERGFTVTAEGALGSLALEFYPDVIGHFKKKHQQTATP